jgi:tetratricopeptide (TPR) repeat protein
VYARSAPRRESPLRLKGLIALTLALVFLTAPALGQEQAERTYLFALKAFNDGLYDVSVQGFREYLASPPRPRHSEANFFLGRALLELGQDAEALAALEAAARADDEGRVAPLARLSKARRYLEMGRYGDGEAETGRWLRYFPRHGLRWEVRVLRGRALVGLRKLKEAASIFEEVSQAEAAEVAVSSEALWRLAAVRAAQGKTGQAASAWKAFIKRAPGDPRGAQARLQLAALAARDGRLQEALDGAEALLKSFPEAPEAHSARLLRAESLFGLERWEEASDAYFHAARADKAAALSEANWERAGLASYRADRFLKAGEALSRAGDGPQGANLALSFKAYRKAEKPVEALKASTRLLAQYPRSPLAGEVLMPSVEFARAGGSWQELREGLLVYIKGAPRDKKIEARYLLAHLELQAGRPEEASRLFGAVASEEGGLDRFRDVRYKRAAALSSAARYRNALELLEVLEQQERTYVGERALLALEADIHRGLEHYKASADRYRALLTRWAGEPEAGRWLLALAEMEEARGRAGEALGAYLRWLEERSGEPAAPLVRLAVARLQVAAGRPDEALKSLDELEAGENQELSAQASLLRGRIALERGEYQAALEASSQAAKGLPQESPAHALARWRMARSFEETGRKEEAASHYRWLSKNAEDDQVREASAERLRRMASGGKTEKGEKSP